jgi:hypothetical protein
MDEAGEAFPSQNMLAADTAIADRTIREAILEARRLSWLAVENHVRPGQAWRRSHYIACVPDGLNLAGVNLGREVDLERMADEWQAKYGEACDTMHGARRSVGADRAKPRKPKGAAAKGADVIAAHSSMKRSRRADVASETCGRGAHEGADVASEKVRTPSPTKFPSEVPMKYPSEGPALTRETGRVENAQEGKPELGTPNPQAAPETTMPATNASALRHIASEGLQGLPRPEPPKRRQPTAEAGAKFIAALIEAGDDLEAAISHARRSGYPVDADEIRSTLRGAA